MLLRCACFRADLSTANDFSVDFSLSYTHSFVTAIKVIYGMHSHYCFLKVTFRRLYEICKFLAGFRRIEVWVRFFWLFVCLCDLPVRKPNASTCMALHLGVGCDVCVGSAMPSEWVWVPHRGVCDRKVPMWLQSRLFRRQKL